MKDFVLFSYYLYVFPRLFKVFLKRVIIDFS